MPKNTFRGGQKKRPQRKAKNKNARQDQRIKKLEQMIYPSVERKSRDVTALAAQIPSSGYSNQPMFQLEQGNGANQRIGEKVTLLSHNVTMTLAAQDTTNSLRIMWVVTPSTTALGIDDVLEYGNYTVH